jgi:hypothetical protein
LLLIERTRQQIVGFSTQVLLDCVADGHPSRVLFSGDTIVAREYWQSPSLARAWGRFALQLVESHSPDALSWLLLSKGYRTYRFLPLFFHEYYPRPSVVIPTHLRAQRDGIATQLYGAAFDSEAGVVRGEMIDNYRVRAGVGDLTSGRLQDAGIRFFAEANPGHLAGDELCCIAPLSRENFTAAARRVIGLAYFEASAASHRSAYEFEIR